MSPMHKVGRIAAIGTSIFVGLAFVLPQTMTGKGGGMADGAIAGGIFLLCMAAASMIAVSTAVWGRVQASRSSQPYETILLAPLIIVILGVAMLFVTAYLKDTFN